MFFRIRSSKRCPENGNGQPAKLKRSPVGTLVDPASQARRNDDPTLDEQMRELARASFSFIACMPGSDNRDGRKVQHVAFLANEQKARRIATGFQQRRIAGLPAFKD